MMSRGDVAKMRFRDVQENRHLTVRDVEWRGAAGCWAITFVEHFATVYVHRDALEDASFGPDVWITGHDIEVRHVT